MVEDIEKNEIYASGQCKSYYILNVINLNCIQIWFSLIMVD